MINERQLLDTALQTVYHCLRDGKTPEHAVMKQSKRVIRWLSSSLHIHPKHIAWLYQNHPDFEWDPNTGLINIDNGGPLPFED